MTSKRWYSGKMQVHWTCKAFLEGRTIGHETEIREVKGWRLGAIVHRLRSEFGWPIEVEYCGPENVAHYRLKSGTKRETLQFPKSARSLSEPEVRI